MGCEEKIDSKALGEPSPLVNAVFGREVGGQNLPVGNGVTKRIFQPLHLRIPEVLEPIVALLERHWPGDSTRGGLVVVHLTADVVAAIVMVVHGVKDIGVYEKEIDRKMVVLHWTHVVQGGCQPAPGAELQLRPSVSNRLVPAVRKHEAAVVVVPQHPQPLLVVQAVALVHALIDVAPLKRGIGDLIHWATTLHSDTAPVEVVSEVDDEVGVPPLTVIAHPSRDVMLSPVIGGVHLFPVVGCKRLLGVVRCFR
mmetsp:Transcript_54578/g.127278  ORF Transcript_54578/g.127278 Transcript_54578/m.127278 type:complete len:253 (-) Transcript_54578:662-1420(-)